MRNCTVVSLPESRGWSLKSHPTYINAMLPTYTVPPVLLYPDPLVPYCCSSGLPRPVTRSASASPSQSVGPSPQLPLTSHWYSGLCILMQLCKCTSVLKHRVLCLSGVRFSQTSAPSFWPIAPLCSSLSLPFYHPRFLICIVMAALCFSPSGTLSPVTSCYFILYFSLGKIPLWAWAPSNLLSSLLQTNGIISVNSVPALSAPAATWSSIDASTQEKNPFSK